MSCLSNKRSVSESGGSESEQPQKKVKEDEEQANSEVHQKRTSDVPAETNNSEQEETHLPGAEDTDTDDSLDAQNEKDVGITEFISNHEGFSAILKQRYSDFVVNEVLLNGKVAHLTSLDCPAEVVEDMPMDGILPEEKQQELEKLMNDSDVQKVVMDVTGHSKQDRRKIHEAIRHHFQGLESKTENSEDKKLIIVFKSRLSGAKRTRQYWPSNVGNFTHFVMYKENKDTIDAINMLAGVLRMKPSSFTYAGTKDRRARTSQIVSVYRVPAKRIASLNNKMKNIAFGNFSYEDKPVQLGDLAGNRFKIVLRNVTGSNEQIQQGLESLEEHGFINYFGMQRFGTTEVPTQAIGRALIQGKWKEAIELIMKPRKREDGNLAECRKVWWQSRDAKAAFEKLRRKNTIEGHLLQGLMAHGEKDLVNALNSIPRNVRLMYIHSYQSYVWNQVVSWRLKKFGLKPVEGDLIMPELSVDERNKALEKNVPQILTKEKLASESISIFDVVLPLPGHTVMLPQNEGNFEDMYKEILSKEGMDMETFRCKVKTYALGGTYRHIVVKPKDISWSVAYYNDPTEQLVLSDIDVVRSVTLPEHTGGKLKALILEFSLPSSSYATMAVREVLKMDTSVQAQKLLTS